MLWYNNPDSVDVIRRARMEERTTMRTREFRVIRTNDDITEMSG